MFLFVWGFFWLLVVGSGVFYLFCWGFLGGRVIVFVGGLVGWLGFFVGFFFHSLWAGGNSGGVCFGFFCWLVLCMWFVSLFAFPSSLKA